MTRCLPNAKNLQLHVEPKRMPPVKAKIQKPVAVAKTAAEAETAAAKQAVFNQLINENALLFYLMKGIAEAVHQQGEMSGGKRSLLRLLNETSAQTVPQISRARKVTRQHIQALIHELVNDGLVEFFENPAHKRSPFVQLTQRGQRFVNDMDRRETKLHQQLEVHVSESEMRAAMRTLRKVRAEFESEPWRRLLKQLR